MSSVYRQSVEPRTDWFRVLADLQRCRLHTRAVARRLGVGKTTVHGWKSGSEPRHSDGERLIALWCQSMNQPRDQVPVCDPYGWR